MTVGYRVMAEVSIAVALVTMLAAADVAIGATPSTLDGNEARIILRLSPTHGAPQKIELNRTGRPALDQLLSALAIDNLRQIIPPLHPGHRLAKLAGEKRLADWVLLKVSGKQAIDAIFASLRECPDVELVESDRIVRIAGTPITPDDPFFSTHQYPLRNTGTQPPYDPGTPGADMEMEAGWAITTGDSSVVLAIIDTGIDMFHPDFIGRIWINPGEGFDLGLDLDSNGFIDDRNGWDFANNDALPQDDHMHGSHVAGIAGATGNNGTGVAGLNWQCRLMPIKVLDANGSGFLSDVTAGISYAVNEGAHVINLSLGGGPNALEESVISFAIAAGVIVVAAMGNDNTADPLYPAAYDSVVSVGATDTRDERAFGALCDFPVLGSNFGPWIDVCAAGDNVWSTFPVAFGSYGRYCLTSMASPHVAGLATLILSLRPDYTADSVRRLIRLGAEDQVGRPEEDTPGFDIYHGWGRINGRITLQALTIPFPPILTVPGPQMVVEGDTLAFTISAHDSNFTASALSLVTTLTNAIFTDHGDGTGELVFTPDLSQAGNFAPQFVASDGTFADTATVAIEVLEGCGCDCHADPQCDGVPDVLDIVHAVNVGFRNEPDLTDPNPNCPRNRTDVDCDGDTDVIDVVHLVAVAFRNEDPAAHFCDACAP